MPDIHVTFKRNNTTIRDEVVNAEEVPENDRSVTTDQGVVVPVATIVYEAYGSEERIYGGRTTLYSSEGEVLRIQTMTAAPPPPEAERKDDEPGWKAHGQQSKGSQDERSSAKRLLSLGHTPGNNATFIWTIGILILVLLVILALVFFSTPPPAVRNR